MKSITVLGVGFVGVVASLLVSGNVLAASSVTGGAACHYYNGAEVRDIEYVSSGVFNTSPTQTRKVVCPVVKQASNFGGIKVRVNLDSAGPRTVSCTLYGYNANGQKMGTNVAYNRLSGIEYLTLQLPSSTPRSYFSVVCALPPNEDSQIYSIESLN